MEAPWFATSKYRTCNGLFRAILSFLLWEFCHLSALTWLWGKTGWRSVVLCGFTGPIRWWNLLTKGRELSFRVWNSRLLSVLSSLPMGCKACLVEKLFSIACSSNGQATYLFWPHQQLKYILWIQYIQKICLLRCSCFWTVMQTSSRANLFASSKAFWSSHPAITWSSSGQHQAL